ncbi:MAG: DUF6356 family protein [Bacteroidota bacterium]|nr:DUF6356 family protein [Bacteroidota bacterium]
MSVDVKSECDVSEIKTLMRPARIFNQMFVDHPASVNETYWQHWCHAAKMLATLVLAVFALFVHMWVPGAFQTTASSLLRSVLRSNDARES